MARCQTHASLSKIYAVLLFSPLPLFGHHQIIPLLVGMGERNLTTVGVGGRGCIEWLYSWIYILYIIKVHTCMHTNYEKLDEGCNLGSRFNLPVLIKKKTAYIMVMLTCFRACSTFCMRFL